MLVYVSGPYSGTPEEIEANIQAARKVAIQLWEMGHAVICPHLNTARFEVDCKATYEQYIAGDLDMLSRCDAMVMVGDWLTSKGANIELDYANRLKIPVYPYYDLPPLHPTEVRCPIQAQAFRELTGRMYRVHLEKNADYSPANIAGTGQIGVVVRLWDKMARLMNLTGFEITISESKFTHPKDAKNEPVEDSYIDLSVYGLIGHINRDGKWGK